MDKNLELLIALQDADDGIAAIERRMESFPAQLSQHDAALGSARAEFDEYKKMLDADVKSRLAKEREVEDKKAAIAKSRLKLNDVKTNQEYHAALAEIDNMKKAIEKLEEEQLEIMERVDVEKAREKELKERVAAEEKEFAKFKAEKEAERARLAAEADGFREERKGVAARLEASLLARYERIFKGREGKAVAELKNGFCLACHQMVLPQLAVEVRTGLAIHSCNHCNRFLYPSRDIKL